MVLALAAWYFIGYIFGMARELRRHKDIEELMTQKVQMLQDQIIKNTNVINRISNDSYSIDDSDLDFPNSSKNIR